MAAFLLPWILLLAQTLIPTVSAEFQEYCSKCNVPQYNILCCFALEKCCATTTTAAPSRPSPPPLHAALDASSVGDFLTSTIQVTPTPYIAHDDQNATTIASLTNGTDAFEFDKNGTNVHDGISSNDTDVVGDMVGNTTDVVDDIVGNTTDVHDIGSNSTDVSGNNGSNSTDVIDNIINNSTDVPDDISSNSTIVVVDIGSNNTDVDDIGSNNTDVGSISSNNITDVNTTLTDYESFNDTLDDFGNTMATTKSMDDFMNSTIDYMNDTSIDIESATPGMNHTYEEFNSTIDDMNNTDNGTDIATDDTNSVFNETATTSMNVTTPFGNSTDFPANDEIMVTFSNDTNYTLTSASPNSTVTPLDLYENITRNEDVMNHDVTTLTVDLNVTDVINGTDFAVMTDFVNVTSNNTDLNDDIGRKNDSEATQSQNSTVTSEVNFNSTRLEVTTMPPSLNNSNSTPSGELELSNSTDASHTDDLNSMQNDAPQTEIGNTTKEETSTISPTNSWNKTDNSSSFMSDGNANNNATNHANINGTATTVQGHITTTPATKNITTPREAANMTSEWQREATTQPTVNVTETVRQRQSKVATTASFQNSSTSTPAGVEVISTAEEERHLPFEAMIDTEEDDE